MVTVRFLREEARGCQWELVSSRKGEGGGGGGVVLRMAWEAEEIRNGLSIMNNIFRNRMEMNYISA